MKTIRCIFLIVLLAYTVAGKESNSCPKEKSQSPTEPCAPRNDVGCVMKYFSKFDGCRRLECGSGDVLIQNHINVPLPYFNMTATQSNVTSKGFASGRITKFMVDQKTDLILITVKYTNISIASDTSNFIYFKTGSEPREIISSTSELYPQMYITSYIKGVKNPQLSEGYHVANVTEIPSYSLGPCVDNNRDPEIRQLFVKFNAMIAVAVQESYSTRAKLFQKQWFAHNICSYE